MLQSLSHPCGPLLNSLQYVHVSSILQSRELDTAPYVWPHQHWIKGKDHLPWPASNIWSSAAEDTFALLSCKGTLLAHTQGGVHQDPKVLSCQVAFQPSGPQPVLLVHGVVPPQKQNFALPLIALHEVLVSPFLQPVEVPLDGSTALQCISHSSLFCNKKICRECSLPRRASH